MISEYLLHLCSEQCTTIREKLHPCKELKLNVYSAITNSTATNLKTTEERNTVMMRSAIMQLWLIQSKWSSHLPVPRPRAQGPVGWRVARTLVSCRWPSWGRRARRARYHSRGRGQSSAPAAVPHTTWWVTLHGSSFLTQTNENRQFQFSQMEACCDAASQSAWGEYYQHWRSRFTSQPRQL